jgi:uncharacterized protein (DUF2235 family)
MEHSQTRPGGVGSTDLEEGARAHDAARDPATRRQIVMCLDGTSNTLTGRQRDTNVLRIFEQIARTADPNQRLYYDPGVGSPDALPITGPGDWLARKWERTAGLAYGRGVYDNVGQAYRFLMREWRPGCEIFLFGFSRGAFTARCVSGMVNLFGVLRPEHDSLMETLMRVYFAPVGGQMMLEDESWRQKTAQVFLGVELEPGSAHSREQIAEQVQQTFSRGERARAPVHFVGVWDTVASVGLPGLSVQISSRATITGKNILHVRHALALDEHRLPFAPRLYTQDNFGDPNQPQSLRQLWFRGVHGDSGGGYAPAQSGLSDAALRWMVDEALGCGLRVRPETAPLAESWVHDPLHTVAWWALAGLTVRDTTCGATVTPVEHASVRAAPPVGSVWQLRRSVASLVLALLGSLIALILQGNLLQGRGWSIELSWQGLALALRAASDFAMTQWQMVYRVPLGAWREAWALPADAQVGIAMLVDVVFIASYGYILARLLSWAFTHCAGYRFGGQARPRWRWLGLALPVLVLGDVAENLLTVLALDLTEPMAAWRGVVLWGAGLGSLTKWAGAIGCAILLGLGIVQRGNPPWQTPKKTGAVRTPSPPR